MKRKAILMVVVTLLLLTSVVLANGTTTTINWHVIAGGGGRSEAGPYALDSAVGQPVASMASANGYELCSGFWCGASTLAYEIYLPLTLKH